VPGRAQGAVGREEELGRQAVHQAGTL